MYKPDLTLDQRRALLQANCEGVEERTYSVPISQEERSNLLEDFLDLNKDLKSIEEEKASTMKDYKKKLEYVRKKQLELSGILESNSTEQKGPVYKMVDREEGSVTYISAEGVIVATRKITPEEKQIKLFNQAV
jgi:acetyl-CoA carboxylase beta subunit